MHELDMSNERANIAFAGALPWHGLGQKVTQGAPLEKWAKEAGLEWQAKSSSIRYSPGFGAGKVHPTHNVLYRDDTKEPLGIVSKTYQVVQPATVLEFFRKFAEAGDMTIETAGSLRGGKKIWALARISAAAQEVLRGDVVEPFILLATSFDGSLSTVGKAVFTRVVCANTVSAALSEKGHAVRVTHASKFNPAAVKSDLGLVITGYDRWMAQARKMAAADLKGRQADEFLVKLLSKGYTDDMPKAADVRESQTYRHLIKLFEGSAIGADLTGGRTKWAMLNSVSQYVDHERGAGNDTRMNSAWFGAGDAMKSRAFELLSA